MPKKMPADVFVYYEMTNFFQNHRRQVSAFWATPGGDAMRLGWGGCLDELLGEAPSHLMPDSARLPLPFSAFLCPCHRGSTTAFPLSAGRYVKSRDDPELRGDTGSAASKALTNCKPELYAANGGTIVPCGLVAWSYFNDTYSVSYGWTLGLWLLLVGQRRVFQPKAPPSPPLPQLDVNGAAITLDKSVIAWPTDVTRKFAAVLPENFNNDTTTRQAAASRPSFGGSHQADAHLPFLSLNSRGGAQIDGTYLNQDQRFMVWMRAATLSTFRKLYGVIHTDLQQGDVVTVRAESESLAEEAAL